MIGIYELIRTPLVKEKVDMVSSKQLMWALGLSMFSFGGMPQAEPLSVNDVLQAVLLHHPDLEVSRLQVRLREAEADQVEAALDTRYGGSIGLNNEIKPASSPFAAGETKGAFVAAQVVKPFGDGSTLTGKLSYNRAELLYPSTVNPAFRATPNPIYQHQIDLTYRYPLAAGSGNPSYHTQKAVLHQEQQAAGFRLELLKEQLAQQTISLYFQLMLSDLSLRLADDAVIRAKKLLASQQKRERFGLIEKAERLQAEALLATRKLQQVQAKAARDVAENGLNRLMFQAGGQPLQLKAVAQEVRLTGLAEMLKKAETNRPVFQLLKAQAAVATSRLDLAQASDDYQLDLVGTVGSRALEAKADAAFVQGFTLDDRYVSLTLEFSDVFENHQRRYVVQRSVLAQEAVALERKRTVELIKTDLANLEVVLRSGETTLQASRVQVAAEKRKFSAEMRRYREGRSTAAIITQFEGDLRSAELRSLIQHVSLDQAKYQLALTLGELPLETR